MNVYDKLVPYRDQVVARHAEQIGRYPDVRLSYWSWSNYRDCPQRYIMYCVGDRIPTAKDEYWAISGSVVHSLWEDYAARLKEGKLEWNDSEDFLLDSATGAYDSFVKDATVDWDAHAITPDEHRHAALPELRESLSFVDLELRRQGLIPRDPNTMHQEYKFLTTLGDAPVQITGRTDLVFENTDDCDVIDLKDVAKKSNIDWRQLVWYALGVEPHFHGKKVSRAGFLFTKIREPTTWRNPYARHPTLKKPLREILTREILETALKIRRSAFKAKVDRHVCGYCPVQQHCPEWQRYSERSAVLDAGVRELSEGGTAF